MFSDIYKQLKEPILRARVSHHFVLCGLAWPYSWSQSSLRLFLGPSISGVGTTEITWSTSVSDQRQFWGYKPCHFMNLRVFMFMCMCDKLFTWISHLECTCTSAVAGWWKTDYWNTRGSSRQDWKGVTLLPRFGNVGWADYPLLSLFLTLCDWDCTVGIHRGWAQKGLHMLVCSELIKLLLFGCFCFCFFFPPNNFTLM